MAKYARLFKGCLGLFLLLAGPWAPAASRWQVYEDCRLMQDQFYDGDSFHVKSGRAHYIFRLYFVDAPETDDGYPDRVKAQADYFGVDVEEIPRLGELASRFTKRFLSGSFTVYTRKEDARGNSEKPRYFALIRAGRKWLGEELVANGLVRIYGWTSDLPDGLPSHKHVANLRVIERSAKRRNVGAWKNAR